MVKKKKKEPTMKEQIDTIFEILSSHKVSIEYLNNKINDKDSIIDKIKGRMGI